MLWITDINFQAVPDENLKNTAYFKAKSDYTQYMQEINAKTLSMFVYYWKDESAASIHARIDGMLAGFHRGDTLIVQLPVYIRPLNIKILIEHIHNEFKGKVIAMIHDYETLLYGKEKLEFDQTLDPLMDVFHTGTYDVLVPEFDALIVHSEPFKDALKSRLNYNKPIVVQGPFGYKIADEIDIPEHKFSRSIVFAGYLAKAQYLKTIPEGWHLDVFGPMVNEQIKQNPNITYHGNFSPTELPYHLPDGFGLVWASETYPEVTGIAGMYTKINYSHKISAYLTAKLPLIVWSKSAPAKWVVENGLGFAVDNLDEITPILDTMTEEKYRYFQKNLNTMSNLIREGIFEKAAALDAYAEINQISSRTKY
ncbi:glycosyltransferase [Pediococcus stilesii]|uniref:Glycosyltransferase n=1 Tax=Pediococcus stilesii TaxID=331679 RepID=A0A5R9BX17_9LACO|nr:sugar transferase [Pediococcus stilesii]TLQ04833.1 glycosyltransferase [Pediococcus stilesii]